MGVRVMAAETGVFEKVMVRCLDKDNGWDREKEGAVLLPTHRFGGGREEGYGVERSVGLEVPERIAAEDAMQFGRDAGAEGGEGGAGVGPDDVDHLFPEVALGRRGKVTGKDRLSVKDGGDDPGAGVGLVDGEGFYIAHRMVGSSVPAYRAVEIPGIITFKQFQVSGVGIV